MRADLEIIRQWVRPGSRVLDLGCGDGQLLGTLQAELNVRGYGLEIEPANIARCLAAGVNVLQQDLNQGIANFSDNSFDTVLMTQALQTVRRPDRLLDDMLRVGRETIITFPNFGYWRTRLYLFMRGRMPISKALPYTWYNTPNIHLCTFRDFESLCRRKQIKIISRMVVDQHHRVGIGSRLLPNLLGEVAIYRVSK